MGKSDIEQDIDEFSKIIRNSKTSIISSNKLVIDREVLEDLCSRMQHHLPKELEYCREIMSRAETIENEAKLRAQNLVRDAENKTMELISENEINLAAKKRADDIVLKAATRGQQIYEEYIREGDAYRNSAQEYLNEMLCNLQEMIYSCIDITSRNTNKFLESLNKAGETITDNLNELNNVNISRDANGSDSYNDQNGPLDVDMNI